MRSQLARTLAPLLLLSSVFPAASGAVDRGWKQVALDAHGVFYDRYVPNAVLVGPEMRGSSPVRMTRSRDSWQVPGIAGLYPVGEGAGYAGGIVTAAVDGLRAAKKIVAEFAQPS